jgi:serine/threonine protein kinase
VPVLETGTDQFGSPFMVMKYLSGGTLKDQLVKRGAHPWREAVQLVGDLAKTLKILHADDIYHRDIKPLNILLDDAGRPHLADFGLAARIELLDTEGSGHSPGYASPEQILYGPSRIDGRSDLYSLGVVFYELLTGKLPIEYQRRLKGDYERRVGDPGVVIPPVRQRNPQVPEAVAALCERCLKWDRNERPQTAADLVEGLGNFCVTSCQASPSQRYSNLSRAYKTWGSLAALLVTTLLALGSYLQAHRRNDSQPPTESPNPTDSKDLITPLDRAMRYRTRVLHNPNLEQIPTPHPIHPTISFNSNSTLTYALGSLDNPAVRSDFAIECSIKLDDGAAGLFFQGDPELTENVSSDSVNLPSFHHRNLGLILNRPDSAANSITVSLKRFHLKDTSIEYTSDELISPVQLDSISVDLRVEITNREIKAIIINHQRLSIPESTKNTTERKLNSDLTLPPESIFGVLILSSANVQFKSLRLDD